MKMYLNVACSGDRLHMLLHHGDPDGGGHLDQRLGGGRGLEGGPLREVRHGGRAPAAALRHGGGRRMLESQRSQ